MRKLLVVTVIAMMVLGFASTGFCADKPEDVVKLFYSSMEKGDLETMFTLVTVEKGKEVAQTCDKIKNEPNCKLDIITTAFLVAGMVKNGDAKIKYSDMKMTAENVSDTEIHVNLTYTSDAELGGQKSTDKNDDTVVLQKIKDKWYVVELIDNLKTPSGS